MSRHQRPISALAVVTLAGLALAVTACGEDDSNNGGGNGSDVPDVESAEPFPDERCEANKAAGTITYLSSFDFAAAASIVEVLVAEERGYFDELCLDVEIQASFSTANYPLIAANDAQFSSARLVQRDRHVCHCQRGRFRRRGGRGPHRDRRPDREAGRGRDARGPPRHDDRREGQVADRRLRRCSPVPASSRAPTSTLFRSKGFDPTVHIAIPSIVGFPGYKSNEPGQLERAGIDFDAVRPDRVRRARLVRRALHEPDVPHRAPVGGAGLRAGGDGRAGRRHRRSGGGKCDRDRADQRQRQPELPLAGGRGRSAGRRSRS